MAPPRPLCQGPSRWSPGATSEGPRRSTSKRQSICFRRRGGSNRRPSTASSPTPVPTAPPTGSTGCPPTARLQGARQFYTLALDAGLELQQRAEVEFRVGYCLQNLGDPADAAKAYQKWIEAHADDSRQMEARYRLGECLLIAGNLPEARKAWRELAKMATALPSDPRRDRARVAGRGDISSG